MNTPPPPWWTQPAPGSSADTERRIAELEESVKKLDNLLFDLQLDMEKLLLRKPE